MNRMLRTPRLRVGSMPSVTGAGSLIRNAGCSCMRRLIQMFALLLLFVPQVGHAKHAAPPRIEPVVDAGVRYVVPNDKGLRAYVEAWDVQSGRKLWTKTIFRHWYCPPFGTECMRYEYITTMVLKDGHLILTSERGREYALDVRTRAVRRVNAKRHTKITGKNAGGPCHLPMRTRWAACVTRFCC